MPFAAKWMQLEILLLSKSERERLIPYDITYMQKLKCGKNNPTTKPGGGGGWSGMDGELGVGRCTLLQLEQITDGVLMYSTGNYVQPLGLEHDRKKIYIYTHTHTYICE